MSPKKECEIVYYRDSNSLGIQGHPEFSQYQKKYPTDLKVIQKLFLDFVEGLL